MAFAVTVGKREKQRASVPVRAVEIESSADEFRARARAAAALNDETRAHHTLAEGAAALLRDGDFAGAIALLEDVLTLDPQDITAHQGLATAHALAGDVAAACASYARAVDLAIAAQDKDAAWAELRAAREALGDLAQLNELEQRLSKISRPPADASPAATAASELVAEQFARDAAERAWAIAAVAVHSVAAPAVQAQSIGVVDDARAWAIAAVTKQERTAPIAPAAPRPQRAKAPAPTAAPAPAPAANEQDAFESYRSAARTALRNGDTDRALVTLREAAAVLARSGDRAGAITLLQDAVAAAPSDFVAHRRLAAAYANDGQPAEACSEYERFIGVMLDGGGHARAWLEVGYARETLGDRPEINAMLERIMSRSHATPPPGISEPREPRPEVLIVPQPQVAAPPPFAPTVPIAPVPETPYKFAADEPANAFSTSLFKDVAPPPPAPVVAQPASEVGALAQVLSTPGDFEEQLERLVPQGTPSQAAEIADYKANLLIGARDPRSTKATVDAARRLIDLHKPRAASDLLLNYIGAGLNDRDVLQMLVDVQCELGQKDVARDRCRVLSTAYRLDGRVEVAARMERIGAAI